MRLFDGALVGLLAFSAFGAHCERPCSSFTLMKDVRELKAGIPPDGRVLVVTGAWMSTQPDRGLAFEPTRTLVAFVGRGATLRTRASGCARADDRGVVLPAGRATFVPVRDAGPTGPADDLLLVPMCNAAPDYWHVSVIHARWSTFSNHPILGVCTEWRDDVPRLRSRHCRESRQRRMGKPLRSRPITSSSSNGWTRGRSSHAVSPFFGFVRASAKTCSASILPSTRKG